MRNRKLPYSWELVEADLGRARNSSAFKQPHPNLIAGQAIAAGKLPGLRTIPRWAGG